MALEDERSARGPLLPFGVAEVAGPSMVPALRHGDLLLVRYGAALRPGAVVVLRHPLQQDLLIVKRLAERRDGGWWVLGDNPAAEGVDSRVFGVVPDELLLGRALLRYRGIRPGRQRSPFAVLGWLVSLPVRPVPALSRRLRAR
ncbi:MULTISPECIES: nickel-type superoxide dismutase maturation protease [unclassified Streptomyces]|uniref:nickel-type superoxide dismutase maturation protease n=1 Tax=unclassified Streptomyces TaxID=2593676 RepID=UPI0008DDB28A|nr:MULTISPECIES: nickel-type superoxide dismutase maturation protease [unclassified Streptomyces]OII66878.1 nickel-type superoxide dismutase maturation protease [Streptomyces sp. CC77]